ncbi:MAG: hypothetical protein JW904_11410 [Spirochaetales bacterium]|nr:hypothetical protein [Spirochaetales bacterium]
MKKYLLFIFIGLVSFSGCQPDITSFEMGNPEASCKILIAGVSSEFKDAVVRKVIDTLGADSYFFKGIGLGEFEKTDLSGYNAVLIVCMYSAGKIDENVRGYFSNDPTGGKLIGLFTVGSERSQPVINIDAVSSASEMNMVEKRAEEIVTLIKKRCGGR